MAQLHDAGAGWTYSSGIPQGPCRNSVLLHDTKSAKTDDGLGACGVE